MKLLGDLERAPWRGSLLVARRAMDDYETEDYYDVIVIGTGLVESMLAA